MEVAAGEAVRWRPRELLGAEWAGVAAARVRPVVRASCRSVNFLSQSSQSQEKGRSPVWVRWWDFRCDDL